MWQLPFYSSDAGKLPVETSPLPSKTPREPVLPPGGCLPSQVPSWAAVSSVCSDDAVGPLGATDVRCSMERILLLTQSHTSWKVPKSVLPLP